MNSLGKSNGNDQLSLTLIEDEPVSSFRTDELDLLPFSRVIAGVASGTGGPFTIGVYGGWGQGKTSVLKQARSLLSDPESKFLRNDVITVWFNAWQYEQEENPIIPLIGAILRAAKVYQEAHKQRASEVQSALHRLCEALERVADSITIKGKLSGGVGEIEASLTAGSVWKALRRKEVKPVRFRESLYDDAYEALAAVRQGKAPGAAPPKIIVFIDDLDRCLPPSALKLMESIKLVLGQEGFIFVLAVDPRILESFLNERYKKDFGITDYRADGTSYLDKIVQLPLSLPPLHRRFDNFVHLLLARPAFQQSGNIEIRKALEGLTEVLGIGSEANPRSLVRFINNLLVDHAIWKQKGREVDASLLGLSSISRILQARIDRRLYRSLTISQVACAAVKNVLDQGTLETTLVELRESTYLDTEAQIAKSMLEALGQYPFLKQLLETSTGMRWLENEDQRAEVVSFLSQERELGGEKLVEEIIEREMTESIGTETRTIAICIDGTWQSEEMGDSVGHSNIARISSLLEKDSGSVVYYSPGIGSGGAISRVVGGAFGFGIRQRRDDCLAFIARNYSQGDRLVLFAAGSGAVTALSVAKSLNEDGLAQRTKVARWGDSGPVQRLETSGKTESVSVEFLGLFDTVSTVSVTQSISSSLLQPDPDISFDIPPNVSHVYHALALDEIRSAFQPCIFGNDEKVEEVWFAGVHSDIVGGYEDSSASDIALEYMIMRAMRHGIAFESDWKTHLDLDPMAKLHDSYSAWMLGGKTLRSLRDGRPLIHWTVIERCKKDDGYQPANLKAIDQYDIVED